MAETDDQQYGVSRLVAFCDGVFAFAITLLITTIPFSLGDLPSSTTNEQIVQQLRILVPGFYAYALSFYIIGNYWLVHHRLFRQIIKYDTIFLWLNLTLLLFIAFLPVPTAFLGRYADNSVITALYALTQTVITLIYLIIGLYTSSHHRLIPPSVDEKTLRYAHWRSFIAVAMFALSIGLAFINPRLATLSWIAIFIVRPLILKKYIQQEPGVTPPLSE